MLLLLNRFWVVVLESKKTALSVWTALPQTLAYLLAPLARRAIALCAYIVHNIFDKLHESMMFAFRLFGLRVSEE